MALRIGGLFLVFIGLVLALGGPFSAALEMRTVIDEIATLDEIEVVERDQRWLSLFWNGSADLAEITLRDGISDADVVSALNGIGFSATPEPTPFHEHDYHQRSRAPGLDADLYRFLEPTEAGAVRLGLTFWDTDVVRFAPVGLVGGLLFIAPGVWMFRQGGRGRTPQDLVDQLITG